MKSATQPKHGFCYGCVCVCVDDSVCGCGPTHTLCRCVSSVQLHYSSATVTHWKSENPGGGRRHDICRLLPLTFWPRGGGWGGASSNRPDPIAVKDHWGGVKPQPDWRCDDPIGRLKVFHEGIIENFRKRRVPSLTTDAKDAKQPFQTPLRQSARKTNFRGGGLRLPPIRGRQSNERRVCSPSPPLPRPPSSQSTFMSRAKL